jgi:hypothetical protein
MKDGQPINENNEVGKEFADKTELMKMELLMIINLF